MNLQRFDNDGLELIIDTETGESFASIRAVARMTDRNESTIRSFVGAQKLELISSEILTPGGLQGARLLDESQILEVVSKYKPELLIKFAQIGLRMFLHNLAGFEYQVKQQVVEQPQLTNRQVSLELANTVRHITDTLNDNPRLAQLLIDNALMDIKANVLPQSNEPELKGVVQIASELGFKTNHSTRVTLGQFIAKQGFTAIKEKRLCNGEMRSINCYPDTDEIRQSITTFFTH